VRTFPAGVETELAKRGRSMARVHLFDVQRADGTNYFWADFEGQFLSRLTGAQQLYKPWVIEKPTIKTTRSLRADGGEFKLQNLSGNTIDREVAALFKTGEFVGAYVVYRPWFIPLDYAPREFHGFIADDPLIDNDAVTLHIRQLCDLAQIPTYEQRQTRACHFRFRSAQCGYRRGDLFVPVTTANIFSASTIGNSGLALTPNLFRDELVRITAGTGSSQERFVLSHTATTFTLKTNWTTTPDGTSQFLVTGPGALKVDITGANIFSASTIGNSGLARGVNGDVDGAVYIVGGTGVGQNRAIASNTATTFTVTPPWTTTPDGTSAFIVAYRSCAKDRASCVTRAVTERFPGIIFLQPQITGTTGPTGAGTGGGRPGGGGSGGGNGRGRRGGRPSRD
jgi:hypothetical protein